VLGFERVEKFMFWADENGPLTLEDPGGKIHIALFESDKPPTSTIAFGANGAEFLVWKSHLENLSLKPRITDHQLAWSLYFSDPFGNLHEITTYEYDLVSQLLAMD